MTLRSDPRPRRCPPAVVESQNPEDRVAIKLRREAMVDYIGAQQEAIDMLIKIAELTQEQP